MDTRQNQRDAAPTGQPARRPRAGLRLGSGALAAAALVAVIAAVIGTVTPEGGSSPSMTSGPAPVTTSAGPDAEVSGDGRTLYVWDPATGNARTVPSGADIVDAELSPDGERLVYEGGPSVVAPQIYVLEADGTQRQLTRRPRGAFDPTWSPDGSQIAFAADSPDEDGTDKDIYVMRADGTDIRKLVGTRDDDGNPDWSPDGEHVAFDGGFGDVRYMARIWVTPVDAPEPVQISPTGRDNGAAHPAWSPDGSWIAHIRFRTWWTVNNRLLDSDVWLMRADGTGGREIWDGGQYALSQDPSWSPDGDAIVFAKALDMSWDEGGPASFATGLVAVDLSTGATTRVLHAAVEVSASWSSDGIVMILPNERDTPPTDPLLSSLPGDATITATGSGCGIERNKAPGRTLTLNLVNDSRHEFLFTIVPMLDRTIGELEQRPPNAYYPSGRHVELGPSMTHVWSGATTLDRETWWAVVCRKDEFPGWHGISYATDVSVAGPIRLG